MSPSVNWGRARIDRASRTQGEPGAGAEGARQRSAAVVHGSAEASPAAGVLRHGSRSGRRRFPEATRRLCATSLICPPLSHQRCCTQPPQARAFRRAWREGPGAPAPTGPDASNPLHTTQSLTQKTVPRIARHAPERTTEVLPRPSPSGRQRRQRVQRAQRRASRPARTAHESAKRKQVKPFMRSDLPFFLERVTGIEPASSAWKAEVLPLNHTRVAWSGRLDSNQRPSAPKADALPSCATPRSQGKSIGERARSGKRDHKPSFSHRPHKARRTLQAGARVTAGRPAAPQSASSPARRRPPWTHAPAAISRTRRRRPAARPLPRLRRSPEPARRIQEPPHRGPATSRAPGG